MSHAAKSEKIIEVIQICDESEDSSDIIQSGQNYDAIDCGEYFISTSIGEIIKKEEFLEFAELTPVNEQEQAHELVYLTESPTAEIIEVEQDDSEDQNTPNCGEFFNFSESTSLDMIEIKENYVAEECLEDRDPLALFSDTLQKSSITVKEFQCPVTGCPAKFKKESMLYRHINFDHKLEVKCPYENCDRSVNPAYLQLHVRKAHNRRLCPNCGKAFYLNFIKRHIDECVEDRPSNFKCGVCGGGFRTKTSWLDHYREAHESPPVKCPVENCDILVSPHRIKNHVTEVHGTMTKLLCKNELLSGEQCGLAFNSEDALQTHIGAVHGIKVNCPHYGCDFLILPDRLNQHLNKVHGAEKCPFEDCYSLMRPKNMKRHIDTVHKKQFCDTCGKEFSDLKNHLKRGSCHPNKKKYAKQ